MAGHGALHVAVLGAVVGLAGGSFLVAPVQALGDAIALLSREDAASPTGTRVPAGAVAVVRGAKADSLVRTTGAIKGSVAKLKRHDTHSCPIGLLLAASHSSCVQAPESPSTGPRGLVGRIRAVRSSIAELLVVQKFRFILASKEGAG